MALARFRKITGKNPSGRFVVSEGVTGCNYLEYLSWETATPNFETVPMTVLDYPFPSTYEILGCTYSNYTKKNGNGIIEQ